MVRPNPIGCARTVGLQNETRNLDGDFEAKRRNRLDQNVGPGMPMLRDNETPCADCSSPPHTPALVTRNLWSGGNTIFQLLVFRRERKQHA